MGEDPKVSQTGQDSGFSSRNAGIVRDERGQEQPADKKRAQQTDSKKKPDTPLDSDVTGEVGSQGGM